MEMRKRDSAITSVIMLKREISFETLTLGHVCVGRCCEYWSKQSILFVKATSIPVRVVSMIPRQYTTLSGFEFQTV